MKKKLISSLLIVGTLFLNFKMVNADFKSKMYLYECNNPSVVNKLQAPNTYIAKDICVGGIAEDEVVGSVWGGKSYHENGSWYFLISIHNIGETYSFVSIQDPSFNLVLTVVADPSTPPPTKPVEEAQPTPTPQQPTQPQAESNDQNKDDSPTMPEQSVTTNESNNLETTFEEVVIEQVSNKTDLNIPIANINSDGFLEITNPNPSGIIQYSFDNERWLVYEDLILLSNLDIENFSEDYTIYMRIADGDNYSEVSKVNIPEELIIEQEVIEDIDENIEHENGNSNLWYAISAIGLSLIVIIGLIYKKRFTNKQQ